MSSKHSGLKTSWRKLAILISKKYKNLISRARSSRFLNVGYG